MDGSRRKGWFSFLKLRKKKQCTCHLGSDSIFYSSQEFVGGQQYSKFPPPVYQAGQLPSNPPGGATAPSTKPTTAGGQIRPVVCSERPPQGVDSWNFNAPPAPPGGENWNQTSREKMSCPGKAAEVPVLPGNQTTNTRSLTQPKPSQISQTSFDFLEEKVTGSSTTLDLAIQDNDDQFTKLGSGQKYSKRMYSVSPNQTASNTVKADLQPVSDPTGKPEDGLQKEIQKIKRYFEILEFLEKDLNSKNSRSINSLPRNFSQRVESSRTDGKDKRSDSNSNSSSSHVFSSDTIQRQSKSKTQRTKRKQGDKRISIGKKALSEELLTDRKYGKHSNFRSSPTSVSFFHPMGKTSLSNTNLASDSGRQESETTDSDTNESRQENRDKRVSNYGSGQIVELSQIEKFDSSFSPNHSVESKSEDQFPVRTSRQEELLNQLQDLLNKANLRSREEIHEFLVTQLNLAVQARAQKSQRLYRNSSTDSDHSHQKHQICQPLEHKEIFSRQEYVPQALPRYSKSGLLVLPADMESPDPGYKNNLMDQPLSKGSKPSLLGDGADSQPHGSRTRFTDDPAGVEYAVLKKEFPSRTKELSGSNTSILGNDNRHRYPSGVNTTQGYPSVAHSGSTPVHNVPNVRSTLSVQSLYSTQSAPGGQNNPGVQCYQNKQGTQRLASFQPKDQQCEPCQSERSNNPGQNFYQGGMCVQPQSYQYYCRQCNVDVLQ